MHHRIGVRCAAAQDGGGAVEELVGLEGGRPAPRRRRRACVWGIRAEGSGLPQTGRDNRTRAHFNRDRLRGRGNRTEGRIRGRVCEGVDGSRRQRRRHEPSRNPALLDRTRDGRLRWRRAPDMPRPTALRRRERGVLLRIDRRLHPPGRHQLCHRRRGHPIENPPAEGSSLAYKLINIVDSTEEASLIPETGSREPGNSEETRERDSLDDTP